VTFWVTQALNGISFGMLLFLLAAGLSLIYGLMRMLNLAHGSYYILGGYVGLATIRVTGSFVLAALAATAVVTLVGVVMERFFLRRFPEQELPQALLTFGFLLIFADLSLWLWGGTPQTLPKPEIFERSIRIGAIVFPSYRLFVIAVGLVIGLGLWWLQEGTRLGAMIRAGVDDAEMARGTGVNVGFLSTAVLIEHPEIDQVHIRGHTVRRSAECRPAGIFAAPADNPSDVGPVAIVVKRVLARHEALTVHVSC